MTSVFNDITVKQTTPQQVSVQQPVATTQPVTVQEAISASNVSDTVEISNKKTKKKGPIKATKEFIANVKKFFATVGAYTKGTAKGVANGAIAGSVVFTTGSVINAVKQGSANRAAKKAGEEAAKVVKKFPSKVAAGIVAVGAFALSLWNASLDATQKQSEIDMKWTGVEPKK